MVMCTKTNELLAGKIVMNQLTERLNRALFNWRVKGMLNTPPLKPGRTSFVGLSMVQHRDVLPYLLAVKSFAQFLSPSRVVLVADPTLDLNDREVLRKHIPHIEIREAAEFQRSGIPKGGCWERLCAIAEYAHDSYVVQLDADTVTTKDIPEVRQAILKKTSFTLGTEDVQPILSCKDAASWARSRLDGKDHTQLLAESKLDQFDVEGAYRYARGCAGFAGFGPGTIDIDEILKISLRMRELVGPQWDAWGTEQFTSNLIVCSSKDAVILPHPKYANPVRRNGDTAFLHFIGYLRYIDSYYSQVCKRAVSELLLAAK